MNPPTTTNAIASSSSRSSSGGLERRSGTMTTSPDPPISGKKKTNKNKQNKKKRDFNSNSVALSTTIPPPIEPTLKMNAGTSSSSDQSGILHAQTRVNEGPRGNKRKLQSRGSRVASDRFGGRGRGRGLLGKGSMSDRIQTRFAGEEEVEERTNLSGQRADEVEVVVEEEEEEEEEEGPGEDRRIGKKIRLNEEVEGDILEPLEVGGMGGIIGSGSGSGTGTASGSGMIIAAQSQSKSTPKSNPLPLLKPPNPPKPHTYHRLVPPKPTYPSLPPLTSTSTSTSTSLSLLKPGKPPQGSVPGNNTSKPKNVVLVSKNTGLGAYLRRCKRLVVDDGFATIHLHALSAAIPHSIMILHSLLDILPFPKSCVGYELKSGSVKCFDERKVRGGVVVNKQKKKEGEEGEEAGGWEWEPVLFDEDGECGAGAGAGEAKKGKEKTDGTRWEEKGDVRVRIVSSLEIIIRIGLDRKKKKVEPTSDLEVDKAEEALQRLRQKTGTGLAAQRQAPGPPTSSMTSAKAGQPGDDLVESEDTTQPTIKTKVKKKNRPNRQQRMARRKKAVAANEAIGRGPGFEMPRVGETMDVVMSD